MDFEKSSIERLKRTLYSRNEDLVPKEKRTPVSSHENIVPTDWGTKPSYGLEPEVMSKKNNSFFNKFLLGSLAFFVVSLGIALVVFFGGINMISSDNLDLKIVAPSSISAGEELLIGLSILNENSADIEEVNLFVEYPVGAKKIGQSDSSSAREKIDLGTIGKGQSKDYSVRAVLYGEKDVLKTFKFVLDYKVKGSNAVFSKEKNYDVIIGSSPIILNISYPKEVNSGQEVVLTLDVTSNSALPIKNVIVKVEYPYGFTFKNSNIKSIRDNSIWNIGDLKQGDKKTLIVSGILLGQNLEDRSFQFSAGTESPDLTKDFETTLATTLATIGIRKSFFDLRISSSNGSSAAPGQSIPLNINWTNTLPDKILNNVVKVEISGNIVDKNKVSVGNGGFYRSVENTIVWDKNSTPVLNTILPGESGQISFSVGSLGNPTQIRSIKNPYINLHITMSGDRTGRDVENISSEDDITIKIDSEVSLIAKSNRNIGAFTNTGPIPPRADKETTYTINWSITNTTNNLGDTIVSTVLPTGVSWKNEISPTGEKITFDPDTRVVSWNAGNISSGVGYVYSPKSVSFKVGLTPSLTQVGSTLLLTTEAKLESIDTFTENDVRISAISVTTRFSDPSFIGGNDIVTQ